MKYQYLIIAPDENGDSMFHHWCTDEAEVSLLLAGGDESCPVVEDPVFLTERNVANHDFNEGGNEIVVLKIEKFIVPKPKKIATAYEL